MQTLRKTIGSDIQSWRLPTASLFAAAAVRYGWSLAALKWMIFEADHRLCYFAQISKSKFSPTNSRWAAPLPDVILAVFVMVPGVIRRAVFSGLESGVAIVVQRRTRGDSFWPDPSGCWVRV